uniref:Uncharacterized protein n=1 Tax=Arundo donax TaxID=35708 RepID=A0A0A8YEZ5_ARUDO
MELSRQQTWSRGATRLLVLLDTNRVD